VGWKFLQESRTWKRLFRYFPYSKGGALVIT
jgi:hypothetical protein